MEKYDVFICHNSQDKPEVRKIKSSLQKENIKTFYDEEDLKPFEKWKQQLLDSIKEVRFFLVFISNHGTGPTQHQEIDCFLKEVLPKKPEIKTGLVILPNTKIGIINTITNSYPYFKELHYGDLRKDYDQSFKKMIADISNTIINSPVPLNYPVTPFKFKTVEIIIISKPPVLPILPKKTEIKFEYIEKTADYFEEHLGNNLFMEMVSIPKGTFFMGSPQNEESRRSNESPQHKVTVPPFFMGKYPVTQKQWRVVANLPKVKIDLESDPSVFEGDNLPVECASWNDAQEFCARLSQKTNKPYRLPSEAEWEYACRAGTTTPFYCGETISTDLANYNGNYTYGQGQKGEYRRNTTEVGIFLANPFGLYDMCGNVWEWCEDDWYENYINAPIDGSAWTSLGVNRRLLRGGSWGSIPGNCRSAYRDDGNLDDSYHYHIGFRVVCSGAARTY